MPYATLAATLWLLGHGIQRNSVPFSPTTITVPQWAFSSRTVRTNSALNTRTSKNNLSSRASGRRKMKGI